MAESVGWKLQQARLARQLEIEDVAETTKIRPERIIDLEADEYGHFPNSTYAKSFLAKYANFLGVDIQDELDKFRVERTISLAAYPYLTGPPVSKQFLEPHRITPRGFRVPGRLSPWLQVVIAILMIPVMVNVAIGPSIYAFWKHKKSRCSCRHHRPRSRCLEPIYCGIWRFRSQVDFPKGLRRCHC